MPQPQPTIFISYASEDLATVLHLRDALAAAGLDVWLDENELGGGDAWDQKIRRQIRECDYFMPVISATTEQRKEGYFRREWRLAAERTLDMADDVMFLIPVAIDETPEGGARVPEKFVAVQWLRVPGGIPTPALESLARRLAIGDHNLPPLLETPPPVNRPPKMRPGAGHHDGPPPMPPFPQLADKANPGHKLKFLAETVWWAITAGWVLLKRAPRWIRVVISIWFIFWVVAHCGQNTIHLEPTKPAAKVTASDKAEAQKALQATAEKLAEYGKTGDKGSTLAQFGSELARSIAAEIKDADNSGKQIVAVPFALGASDEADAKFLGDVFTPLYGRLAVARANGTGVVTKPLAAVTDESLVALGQKLDAAFVLGASLTHEAGIATLQVRLMRIEDASVAWTGRFPIAGSEPADVAGQIATAVLAAAPAK